MRSRSQSAEKSVNSEARSVRKSVDNETQSCEKTVNNRAQSSEKSMKDRMRGAEGGIKSGTFITFGKKPARKGRLALTLSLSVFVFIINTVALLFAIALVYSLTRLGVIDMSSGQMGLSAVLTVISLTSLVLGFLLTVFTGKIPLRPVNSLVDQLNRLAGGDFGARLNFGKTISSHPTFQQIETSFNRAAEELEHTEMLRSNFINNFSHEFKTPIVSIAGFAKLLRRGNLTEEQRGEYLTVIEEESLRLSALANNVLSLTRVENQTILTDITEFNLSEQIRSAVLLLADKWTAAELNMDLCFSECIVRASEELLKQVWINLLDNAIKFSPRGGTVTVTLSDGGDTVTVSVTNSGSEIPPESIAYIFNKFYQADESHSSEGNGIGLAIVKRVCELHGGAVSAESGDGKTTFTVILSKRETPFKS